MKQRHPADSMPRSRTVAVRTGEHCPVSGWWYPVHREMITADAQAVFVGRGSLMPATDGAPASWIPEVPARTSQYQ